MITKLYYGFLIVITYIPILVMGIGMAAIALCVISYIKLLELIFGKASIDYITDGKIPINIPKIRKK